MIILLCGMSGAGKSTLSTAVSKKLEKEGLPCEVIDGDEYRGQLFKDLGYSLSDRRENMRRLSFLANKFSKKGIITIISAINPFEQIRQEIKAIYKQVKIVYIHCEVEKLMERDTKGLYRRSQLPDGHPDKVYNLTGVNQVFEAPKDPDLCVKTDCEPLDKSIDRLYRFIAKTIRKEELNIGYA